MTDFPDEVLPRRLDAAEAELARSEHRWFARITLLTALATGFTLLLPWTYTRRYGLSVWQLGVETHPALAFTWLAGIVTTVATLALEPVARARVTAGVTAVIAGSCLAVAWQATNLDPVEDTWPGPGPSFAIATSVLWLLAAVAQLVAQNNNPAAPDEAAVVRAIARLRRTR
ncbi:hypothetical protein E1218_00325 [Kribbella turkmenica]|uniref:Uncharacterized protein n=1 Tax=Kribbella turkmenica TaxID=2530375 RepID=A0A4R4XIV8_9ACTN|nr:hypothetical protein [Kribbella turkmenica]TDD30795.1 hypothetical protein E1218_00325 [Kribbella turkmenica]